MLERQFPSAFYYCVFYTGCSAIEELNPSTDLIIVNNYLAGENGTNIAKTMLCNNPNVKVIMLTSSQDILIEVERYLHEVGYSFGQSVQQHNSFSAIKRSKIMYPFNYLIKEFKIKKVLLIFILALILVGLTSFILINIEKNIL